MNTNMPNNVSIPITISNSNEIIHADGDKQKEKFIKICRRYWITFLPIAFLVIFLTLAPFLLIGSLSWFFSLNILETEGIGPFVILSLSAYLLCLFLFALIHWIDFYFDVTFITNQRIVDIDQIGIVKRATTAINIIDAREVKASFNSITENLFNYGSINIQCSTKQTIDIEKVKDPKGVAKILNDLHGYLEYERNFDQRRSEHHKNQYMQNPALTIKPIYVDAPQ